MPISLDKRWQIFVKEQVEQGRYKTEAEVIEDGLRLVEAGVSGIAGLPFPKKKLRRKNSVREETVEVRTEALQRWCV